MSLAQRRKMVDREHPSLSMTRQCVLLGVSRSGLYYRSRGTWEEDRALMQAMDGSTWRPISSGLGASGHGWSERGWS